jgi:hypothetical protein
MNGFDAHSCECGRKHVSRCIVSESPTNKGMAALHVVAASDA